MLVCLPPVLFSLSSLSISSVKLRILENFTLYLRNSWSLNLRAIENCICGLRSIGRKMRSILRTVRAPCIILFFDNHNLVWNFLSNLLKLRSSCVSLIFYGITILHADAIVRYCSATLAVLKASVYSTIY